MALLTPWFQTSGFQDCERTNFCCFQPPAYGIHHGSRGTLIQQATNSVPQSVSNEMGSEMSTELK